MGALNYGYKFFDALPMEYPLWVSLPLYQPIDYNGSKPITFQKAMQFLFCLLKYLPLVFLSSKKSEFLCQPC